MSAPQKEACFCPPSGHKEPCETAEQRLRGEGGSWLAAVWEKSPLAEGQCKDLRWEGPQVGAMLLPVEVRCEGRGVGWGEEESGSGPAFPKS